jgi:hypothetical protein
MNEAPTTFHNHTDFQCFSKVIPMHTFDCTILKPIEARNGNLILPFANFAKYGAPLWEH